MIPVTLQLCFGPTEGYHYNKVVLLHQVMFHCVLVHYTIMGHMSMYVLVYSSMILVHNPIEQTIVVMDCSQSHWYFSF